MGKINTGTNQVADLLQKFVGQYIKLKETTQEISVLGKTITVTNYDIDESDPVYRQLKKELDERYGRVRFMLPGTMHTMEYLLHRVNVEIGKKGKIKRIYMG